jgi:hypothetical protein
MSAGRIVQLFGEGLIPPPKVSGASLSRQWVFWQISIPLGSLAGVNPSGQHCQNGSLAEVWPEPLNPAPHFMRQMVFESSVACLSGVHGVGAACGEEKFEGTWVTPSCRGQNMANRATTRITAPANAYLLFITLASLYCGLLRTRLLRRREERATYITRRKSLE